MPIGTSMTWLTPLARQRCELRRLDPARGVLDVGEARADAAAEQLHARAGAGRFDDRRVEARPVLGEALGDRGGEGIDGRRADDVDLLARRLLAGRQCRGPPPAAAEEAWSRLEPIEPATLSADQRSVGRCRAVSLMTAPPARGRETETVVPSPSSRRDVEPAAVAQHDMLDDGEAEAGAADRAAAARIDAVEALGEARDMVGRDALALVDRR